MRRRLKPLGLLACFSAIAQAHVVSISTGELHVDGPTATFELRIPMYEAAPVPHPESTLLAHIRFGDGHLVKSACGQEESFYVCRAEYEFPRLHRDSLEVECTLYQVTVPNHVHLLTAIQGGNTDQQVFDQRFTGAEIRFHPPSPAEKIARNAIAGATRALASASGLLFLFGLALAARSKAEAITFGAVFLLGEAAARPLGPLLPVSFTARQIEAVLALSVVYLAIEILLLPGGGSRWSVVAVLGLLHGVSLAGFPASYLIGAMPVQAVLLAALALAALKMPRVWLRPSAGALMIAALAWFGLRLWRS